MSAEEQASPEATAPTGRVVTFYSYKGGVGRSMALANVAALLAGMGKRVLVVDWDLEAPGLEKYFGDRVKGRRTFKAGVVDLLSAFVAGQRLPWMESLLSVRLGGQDSVIKLLGAGRDDDGHYGERLRTLDWERLFKEHRIGDYLEELRDEWLRNFDFVLIDSRTGITDIGGVCTIHVPDLVVALFTANEQSIDGTFETMRRARHERAQLPFDRAAFPLRVVPLLARDEISERELSEQWKRRAASVLGELFDWLPEDKADPVDALEVFKIPYVPYWSFGERLPVDEEKTRPPGSISFAYQMVAQLIESDCDWERALSGATAATAAKAEAERAKAEAAQARNEAAHARTEADKTRRKARRWVLAVFGGIAVLAAAVLMFARSYERRSVDATKLAAAQDSKDPLITALILASLPDSPAPDGALKLATETAAEPLPLAVLQDLGIPTAAEFSPDGSRVIVTGSSGPRIYPADGRGDPRLFPTSRDDTLRASYTPDGARVALVSDAAVSLYDVSAAEPKLVARMAFQGRPTGPLNFDASGTLMALATNGGQTDIWNTKTGRVERTVAGSGNVTLIGDDRVLCAYNAGQLAVTNLVNGQQVPLRTNLRPLCRRPPCPDDTQEPRAIGPLQVNVERTQVVQLYENGDAWIWNLLSPAQPPRHLRMPATVTTLGGFAQHQLIAITAPERSTIQKAQPSSTTRFSVFAYNIPSILDLLRLKDDPAGAEAPTSRMLAQVSGLPSSMAISSDGALFAMGMGDGRTVVLRTSGNTSGLIMKGHGASVFSVAFSADGKRLATVSVDGTARIWSTEPPAQPNSIPSWEETVTTLRAATSACLSKDQRRLFLSETPQQAALGFMNCEKDHGRNVAAPRRPADDPQPAKPAAKKD